MAKVARFVARAMASSLCGDEAQCLRAAIARAIPNVERAYVAMDGVDAISGTGSYLASSFLAGVVAPYGDDRGSGDAGVARACISARALSR